MSSKKLSFSDYQIKAVFLIFYITERHIPRGTHLADVMIVILMKCFPPFIKAPPTTWIASLMSRIRLGIVPPRQTSILSCLVGAMAAAKACRYILVLHPSLPSISARARAMVVPNP